MSRDIGWHHPHDEAEEWDGFNDSGIETFAGRPIENLAREIHQNSLDAHDGHKPVKVSIKLNNIKTNEIPGIDELTQNFQACYESSKNESRKAEVFFEEALDALQRKSMPVLTISDFNTKGMKGPATNGTPYYAFMKAKGQSKKESDAGGSYGIGKLAPYAVSKLRTIFISTVYEDENSESGYTQLTQGKSILMSHVDDSGVRRGTGFWGEKKRCHPIDGISDKLPSWIQRADDGNELASSKGSKLTILNFEASKHWEEKLAISVATNFFGAIFSGRLIVEISDSYYIDDTNITQILEDPELIKVVESEGKDEVLKFSNFKNYLATLTNSSEVISEESELREFGLSEVKILVGENLPKKVCFLRNGMFITDNLDGLKSFSNFKEFVAVFSCQNIEGNALLRAMEPPKHDGFEPDRLPTEKERKKARRALRALAQRVRDMLNKHAKDPVSEVTTLDELKDFFADDTGEDGGKATEEINPFGALKIRGKPIKQPTLPTGLDPEDQDGDDDGDSDGGGGAEGKGGGDGKGGTGRGTGGSSSPSHSGDPVSLDNLRAITQHSNTRKIIFTPKKTGMIHVQAKEVGADSDFDINFTSTDVGEIYNGGVRLNAVRNERLTMIVNLEEDFSGALKVIAYEV